MDWIGFPLYLHNAAPGRPRKAHRGTALGVPDGSPESVVFCFSVVWIGTIQWAQPLKVLRALERLLSKSRFLNEMSVFSKCNHRASHLFTKGHSVHIPCTCPFNNISTNGYRGRVTFCSPCQAIIKIPSRMLCLNVKKRIQQAHTPTVGDFVRGTMPDSR